MSVSAEFTRSATPIPNIEIHDFLCKMKVAEFFVANTPYRFPINTVKEFLNIFESWIASSTLNDVQGLGRFGHRYLASGVTQIFDDFYMRHINRTMVFFRGEYPYLRRFIKNWRFYDGEFKPDDAFIISAPFSATGEAHPNHQAVLEQAEAKKFQL